MISLLASVAIAALAAAGPADVRLDVPYLPQTDLLCGGAAAAMVFRYWGDRHADASPFEPLVDRRAGGISTSVLVDAIRNRNWRAVPFTGTIDLLRDELAAGHPIILLIGDHPSHYHYVVVVGVGADDVIVHDPEWGPSRVLTIAALTLAWQATSFWAVDIVPENGPVKLVETPPASGTDEAPPPAASGINVNAAAALSDYAGVRFAARQWSGAASLAEEALSLNPADRYAWDVLGSSRFMMDDLHGALDAWNHIDKPRIDLIAIDGLARTRYALVAEALALEPNALLTDERFRAAERRLEQLPDRSNSRIGFRPGPDGFAVVDVVIVEQQTRPKGFAEWGVAAGSTYANQELTATIPGGAGQGSLWTASWRWWANRPRVGIEFAAPQVRGLPGTFRVNAFWAAQTFDEASSVTTSPGGAPVREDQLHGGLRWSNWIDSRWRYELSFGADLWGNGNEANDVGRAVSVGATLEPHFLNDHVIATASFERWMPLSGGEAFHSMSIGAAFQSSRSQRGFVETADVGAESASDTAPLSIWPGAGDGHARVFLLRAHPLLHGGIIDGPVFGREIVYGNAQVERWLEGKLSSLAVATFVDTARASGRFFNVPGTPFQVDAGAGLRFRVPFELGTFRVDYAHGIRDGEDAITWGWEK